MKLFGLMILFSISSFAAPIASRIYGGSSDTNNTWNSAVAIATSDDRVFCSGVVIAPNKILTAGHCVKGNVDPYIATGKVLFGTGGNLGWQHKINIVKYEHHPDYSQATRYNWHDFGLITLASNVPTSVKIIPALSVIEGQKLFAQSKINLVQVGYGRRENNVSGEKFFTENQITRVFETEYEAGLNDGRGACRGDSGGPTFAQIAPGQWRIVGIASRVPIDNDVCQTYGQIFGRVDAAVQWYNTQVRLFGYR